jgi:hypothetical protein
MLSGKFTGPRVVGVMVGEGVSLGVGLETGVGVSLGREGRVGEAIKSRGVLVGGRVGGVFCARLVPKLNTNIITAKRVITEKIPILRRIRVSVS